MSAAVSLPKQLRDRLASRGILCDVWLMSNERDVIVKVEASQLHVALNAVDEMRKEEWLERVRVRVVGDRPFWRGVFDLE